MTEIVVQEDCGNSPRKAWLRDFNLAFIEGDIEAAVAYVAEDVVWDLVGEAKIEGRDGMRAWLQAMAGKKARRVVLENIITHGTTAAINGTYEMESGSAFAFCDIYEFVNAKSDSPIRDYKSYVIRLQ